MVKVPLLEVTRLVTLPAPFQLPPVTPKVPAILPPALRLTIPLPVRVALPLIVPEPVNVPAVPTPTVLPASIEPSTCKVPAVTDVAPVYVLVPVRTVVPLPTWDTAPLPLMTLAKSVPWVSVLLRLNSSVALLVIALLAEREPVAPPAPICRVPSLIVVLPV